MTGALPNDQLGAMARSFALLSQPSWLRFAAWLRREHVAARLAVVLTVAATLSGIATYVVLSGWFRFGADVDLVLGLLYLDVILLLLLGVLVARAARAAGGGALAELGRLAPARPPGRPVQPGRGGAGDRGRGVLGRLPPLRPRGLVQRADQRRADQLAERRPLLPRGAQGGDPRRRARDGRRPQSRGAGAARHAGDVPAACSTPRRRCAR